jgi:carboxylesterase type B
MSVTTLLSLPRAQGLFARAITQSGSVQAAADPADAALVAKELGLVLGREATAASLAEVGLPELIRAQTAVRDALVTQPDPADRMHAAWIAFARDGDPGWRPFDDTYPVMIFDSPGGGLQADPRGDERRIWAHSG